MVRLILCAGLSRSGSTWQYNAVRLLGEAAFGSVYGGWVADYDPTRAEPLHVVKAHKPGSFDESRVSAIVTCYRDLRDVVASMRRMKWRDYPSQQNVAPYLDWYLATLHYWEPRSAHVMRYETMVADPLAELRRLAGALGLDLSETDIAGVAARIGRIAPPSDEPTGTVVDYDKQSLLHAGHIGAARTELDDTTRRAVELGYGAWLKARGYPVPDQAGQ